MNPVVIVHFIAGIIALVAAVPLIRGKVGMNHWYGIRIPAAFVSEAAWLDLNRYGGRLLFIWGLVILLTALTGAALERKLWVTYDLVALVIILGGLAWVTLSTVRYARKREKI